MKKIILTTACAIIMTPHLFAMNLPQPADGQNFDSFHLGNQLKKMLPTAQMQLWHL